MVNWWDASSTKNFKNRAQCVVDQYNNYTLKQIDENIQGQDTLAENIADHGGSKVAYLAYRKYRSCNIEVTNPFFYICSFL